MKDASTLPTPTDESDCVISDCLLLPSFLRPSTTIDGVIFLGYYKREIIMEARKQLTISDIIGAINPGGVYCVVHIYIRLYKTIGGRLLNIYSRGCTIGKIDPRLMYIDI